MQHVRMVKMYFYIYYIPVYTCKNVFKTFIISDAKVYPPKKHHNFPLVVVKQMQ